MIFGGWQKFSLLDFPGNASAILFTQGCPFRCPFCHNPELVNASQGMFAPVTEKEILDFLKTRQGKLDGVVISGGEPTLQHDLAGFARKIKKMGFKIKLDTNGSNPEKLKELIDGKLVDYVAMDYKAPLNKYGANTGSAIDAEKIRQSAKLVMESGLPYEFRTTVVKEILSPEDLKQIGRELQGAKLYILQKFNPEKTLDPDFAGLTTYTEEEFKQLAEQLKPFVAQCLWR